VDVATSDTEPPGPSGKYHARPALIHRPTRGSNALHSEIELEERVCLVARGALDRQPGDPCGRGERDVRLDMLRVDREPPLEIRVHRYVHGGRDDAQVVERLGERDPIVGATQRPRETGARGRQRPEPELFQGARAPSVPRVRHHEAAGGVQAVKGRGSVVTHVDAPTMRRY